MVFSQIIPVSRASIADAMLKKVLPVPWDILGVPEKAERRIFSTLRAESVIYFYIIR